MAKNVLILADVRRQKLRNVTFEMLAAANAVAEGGTVSVAVLGSGVEESLVGGLGDAGADTVYLVDAPELANYTPNAYKKAFMEAVARCESGYYLHGALRCRERPRSRDCDVARRRGRSQTLWHWEAAATT